MRGAVVTYETRRIFWTAIVPTVFALVMVFIYWPKGSTPAPPADPVLNCTFLGRDPGLSIYEYTHPVTGKKFLIFWGDNGRLSTQPE